MKGKYHLRIMLNDNFGFAEHQEKITYGLGFNITLTKKKDEVVINKTVDVADARIKTDHTHWYVPLCLSSTQQQGKLCEKILSKMPTELK